VNIVYTVLESPNRWSILAALSSIAGLVGAIVIITYAWSVWLARIWLLAGLAIAAYCLVRLLLQFKAQVDEAVREQRPKTED
jgi:hypothetical protein